MANDLQLSTLDIELLLLECEAGTFYEDYDHSVELLGRARKGFLAIQEELMRCGRH